MARNADSRLAIPGLVRAFAWVLIVAGTFFAYVFLANPGLTFPGAHITDYSSQLGFYSTGVRVIGDDVIVGLVTGGTAANTAMIAILAPLRLIRAEQAATVSR